MFLAGMQLQPRLPPLPPVPIQRRETFKDAAMTGHPQNNVPKLPLCLTLPLTPHLWACALAAASPDPQCSPEAAASPTLRPCLCQSAAVCRALPSLSRRQVLIIRPPVPGPPSPSPTPTSPLRSPTPLLRPSHPVVCAASLALNSSLPRSELVLKSRPPSVCV